MMHIRGLVLWTLFLRGVARRSLRVDDSSQQNNTLTAESAEARESFLPGGFGKVQLPRVRAAAAAVRLPGRALFGATPRAREVAMADETPSLSKADLLEAISAKGGVSKSDASQVLSATLETIVEAVSEGKKVQLTGFGTFAPKERKERKGRNVRTGAAVTIPAATVPSFSFGKNFKDAVKAANPKGHSAPAGTLLDLEGFGE